MPDTEQAFLPTIPIDTSSFALWLHENAPKFVNSIDESAEVVEDLCRADIMKSDDDIVSETDPVRDQMLIHAVAIEPTGYCIRPQLDHPRHPHGSALPSSQVRPLNTYAMIRGLSESRRSHQKIIKPQFFEMYRAERDNVSKLDIASGHIAKKAVTASNVLAAKDTNADIDQAAWGGLDTRSTLATELIPMMIKIQAASRRKLQIPWSEVDES